MKQRRSSDNAGLDNISSGKEMVLLIAYGNSLRRDDGAGFILAEKIEHLFHEAGRAVIRIDAHQLTPELALDIAGENISTVLFMDTRAVSDPDDDLKIHVVKVAPTVPVSPSMGHHMDASLLLTYAAHLFKTPPPAWLLTVPGVDFDHGEGISQTARKALDNPPPALWELIGGIASPPCKP